MMAPTKSRHENLKPVLNSLYRQYVQDFRRSRSDFFSRKKDPILFPHRFRNFHDVEATAFLASTFAYGNVRSLCAFVENLISLLQPSPYRFLKQGPRALRAIRKQDLYYRFHKGDQIVAVLEVLARVYRDHESLYSLFLSYYYSNTIKDAITAFVRHLHTLSQTPLSFLLPLPSAGSTCKRLNLFLRWMVRRDEIDFGLWKEVSPADLIMPVDTHIGRLAYRLGWIGTPSLSWKKAEEITSVLRRYDPNDPTRYDFSLCHESISRSPLLQGMLTGKP